MGEASTAPTAPKPVERQNSLERARALVYRPPKSTNAVVPASSSAPAVIDPSFYMHMATYQPTEMGSVREAYREKSGKSRLLPAAAQGAEGAEEGATAGVSSMTVALLRNEHAEAREEVRLAEERKALLSGEERDHSEAREQLRLAGERKARQGAPADTTHGTIHGTTHVSLGGPSPSIPLRPPVYPAAAPGGGRSPSISLRPPTPPLAVAEGMTVAEGKWTSGAAAAGPEALEVLEGVEAVETVGAVEAVGAVAAVQARLEDMATQQSSLSTQQRGLEAEVATLRAQGEADRRQREEDEAQRVVDRARTDAMDATIAQLQASLLQMQAELQRTRRRLV